ncbi:MAG: NAD-dependent DNA ligase LigA [Erysipelotrichaceae bacterium]|nr:NAD-dependent DNA ligase LigA [Erysipelotrichaceae bacterium]
MDDKRREMQLLVEELNRASDAYYNGRNELMTDWEWDAKFDRLKKLEEETGIILSDSPTNKVSEDNVAGQKEAHEFSALSLAKTKKVSDLVKWAQGRKIWLSWKLDGLTLVVTYDNGRLAKVVTRGDGHIGTNITHLAKAISGILPKIEEKGHLVIRGEAVISYEDFERFNLESDEDYANPRNLASGSLTLKDVDELARRHLRWIPFTLVHTDKDIVSWGERMRFLEELGFKPVEREEISVPDEVNIQKSIDRFSRMVTTKANPYPVDGLVICYDDTVYASQGSVTGHHATNAGYAFKWQDESRESVLDHIEWSCAASTITPVAIFAPIDLEGTVVKRASLCNISECERLGIGDQGTKIEVIKANKIIPKVIRVNERKGELIIPEHCPICGSPTQIRVSENSGTRSLVCMNPNCSAKKLRKFARFVSKMGADIDGMSEQTLNRFINEGWIRENADIYRLNEHKGEIAALEGFGDKSESNLLAAIEKAREIDAEKLLVALTIPMCGVDVARKLLSAYQFNDLIQKARETREMDHFAHIDGIGPEKSTSFIRWMQNDDNFRELERLLSQVRVTQTEQKASGSGCAGLTFVVTGDVYQFRNRNELKAYIESQGGKVTGSVTGKTSFLINNDITSTSGKNQKAAQLGIPVISEQQFIDQFGKN